MRRIHFYGSALIVSAVTACGSDDTGHGPHGDYSEVGSAGFAGAQHIYGQAGAISAANSSGIGLAGSGALGNVVMSSAAYGAGGLGTGSSASPTLGGAVNQSGASGVVDAAKGGGSIGTSLTSTPIAAGGAAPSNPIGVGGALKGGSGGTVGNTVTVAKGGNGGTVGNTVTVAKGGNGGANSSTNVARGGTSGGATIIPPGGAGGASTSTGCSPGTTKTCNTGLLGICATGKKTCDTSGRWSGCVQDYQKRAADCSSTADNNCDGHADNTQLESYRFDVDGDGYCTQGSVQYCIGSQPATAILASTCKPETDCSDSNHFRNIRCTPCVSGIEVTVGDASAPAGYQKLGDLNRNCGEHVWLWQSTAEDAPCIATDIALSFSRDTPAAPFGSGWYVNPTDLNEGCDKAAIHIGWWNDPAGVPIRSLSVVASWSKIKTPTCGNECYYAQWTDGSGNADADKDTGDEYVYVAFTK